MMLSMFSAALAMGFAALLIRDVMTGATAALPSRAVVMSVLGATAALLFARKTWSLPQLRVLEIVVFATITLYLAARAYVLGVADLSLAGGSGAAAWNATLLRFVLLVVAYSVFVPNTPLRAAPTVLGITLTPLAVALLVRARHPELRAVFDAAAPGRVFDTALVLGLSVGMALFAAFLIDKLFSAAYESRRANFY